MAHQLPCKYKQYGWAGSDSNSTSTNITPPRNEHKSTGHFVPFQQDLIGDPFLGSSSDLDTEMNWEQLDSWAKIFQNGY